MAQYFDGKLVFEYLPELLSRIHITLLLVFTATVFGMIFGSVLALIRIHKILILNQLVAIYISFVRGTPIIVQMFIVYYGFPAILMNLGIDINRWDKLIFVIITYGLNTSAFMSEIIRSAITSVSIGQSEASYSVGLTKIQTFYRIIGPQALKTALPSISTTIVGLLQDSAIAFSLGIVDVMGEVQVLGARTYHTIEGYVAAGIIFFVLGAIVEKVSGCIEKNTLFSKL